MKVTINCIQNDQGAWCKDTRVPKSLFGLGVRRCMEFNKISCPYKQAKKIPAKGHSLLTGVSKQHQLKRKRFTSHPNSPLIDS